MYQKQNLVKCNKKYRYLKYFFIRICNLFPINNVLHLCFIFFLFIICCILQSWFLFTSAAIEHNISFLKIILKQKCVLNKRKFLLLEKYFTQPPAYFSSRIFSLFSITLHHALFLQIFIYHHLHPAVSISLWLSQRGFPFLYHPKASPKRIILEHQSLLIRLKTDQDITRATNKYLGNLGRNLAFTLSRRNSGNQAISVIESAGMSDWFDCFV